MNLRQLFEFVAIHKFKKRIVSAETICGNTVTVHKQFEFSHHLKQSFSTVESFLNTNRMNESVYKWVVASKIKTNQSNRIAREKMQFLNGIELRDYLKTP